MSCAEVGIKVCSICLSTGTDHYTLEKKFKSLLSSIAPEMRLEISETSFTCCECLKKLVDLYYFKALYLDSEEKVRDKVADIGQKISLLRVVFPLCAIEGDEYFVNICRICLTVIETEVYSTLTTEIETVSLSNMIKSAMPELIMDLTFNPIVCEPCTVKIVEMYVFHKRCMETEHKIKSFLENTGTSIDKVNKSFLLLNIVKHFKETKDNKLIEYDCDSCDFKTYKGDDLKRHKMKKHRVKSFKKKAKSEAKPYKCTICNTYATNKKNNLTKHMARHTKQSSQTFLCSTCDFQTNSKFDLKKHTADRHSEKDNSSFLCPKCSYTSNKRRNLSKHLARHRKKDKQTDITQTYKCSSCSFDTKIKYDLTRHMLIHKKPSESIMYKCKICPYQTNRKDNLSIHNLRHKCQENTSNDVSEVEN
ncbi:zinc finger X-chromosomal protein-like [Anoplophora glabripennis]|uniref:zinc finger X-chromosomal protein-like n=1 Tax=Anoplophora glabripennis TaxID=217634 RepID=UPI0008740CE8|nr:zinc finger X-chromosomal protein-like [Anoplophora glabripennis]